jgi:hypothetical protein
MCVELDKEKLCIGSIKGFKLGCGQAYNISGD